MKDLEALSVIVNNCYELNEIANAAEYLGLDKLAIQIKTIETAIVKNVEIVKTEIQNRIQKESDVAIQHSNNILNAVMAGIELSKKTHYDNKKD